MHCSLEGGCAHHSLALKAILHASPINVSAFTLSLLMRFLMPSIMPHVASAPLQLTLSSSSIATIAVTDVRSEPHGVEKTSRLPSWQKEGSKQCHVVCVRFVTERVLLLLFRVAVQLLCTGALHSNPANAVSICKPRFQAISRFMGPRPPSCAQLPASSTWFVLLPCPRQLPITLMVDALHAITNTEQRSHLCQPHAHQRALPRMAKHESVPL